VDMDGCLCECCVLSGRGVCDGPITSPEEAYRVCVCVSLSVITYNNNPLHLQRVRRRGQTKTERKKERKWAGVNVRRSCVIISVSAASFAWRINVITQNMQEKEIITG